MNERYLQFKELAETRGVISLGISTFRYMTDTIGRRQVEDENGITMHPSEKSPYWCLRFSLFNILCKPPGDYFTDAFSAKFLEAHKFDFDRQRKFGVPYSRAWHDTDQDDSDSELSVNRIFDLLVLCKKPIVLHCGFYDLVYLYSSLFGSLPSKVDQFRAHLNQLFPSGIYDTKFFGVCLKISPHYLEYLFLNEQRLNLVKMKNRKRCVLVAPEAIKNVQVDGVKFISRRNLYTKVLEPTDKKVCFSFADHGNCDKNDECTYNHNVDAILDEHERQRCTAYRGEGKETESLTSLRKLCYTLLNNLQKQSNAPTPSIGDQSNAHDAAYDAFMTGFAFACMLNHLDTADRKFSNYVNRIYLTGSREPFFVPKSDYIDISVGFKNRLERITG